jgi:hypothetical protein
VYTDLRLVITLDIWPGLDHRVVPVLVLSDSEELVICLRRIIWAIS